MLAAAAYHLPLFRSVTSHPLLAAAAVLGAPGGRPVRDLQAAAWSIVAPRFDAPRRVTAARLRRVLAAGGPATVDTNDAVDAALTGRVETLFVDEATTVWGRVTGARAEHHDVRHPGDLDLVEAAALATLDAGGTVHVDAGRAATGPVAALLRW